MQSNFRVDVHSVLSDGVFEFHIYIRKLQAYGHPFSIPFRNERRKNFLPVVILYKLTVNVVLPLKRFPPIIYTNRCVQTKSFIFSFEIQYTFGCSTRFTTGI